MYVCTQPFVQALMFQNNEHYSLCYLRKGFVQLFGMNTTLGYRTRRVEHGWFLDIKERVLSVRIPHLKPSINYSEL
jgi:hypothetical protein